MRFDVMWCDGEALLVNVGPDWNRQDLDRRYTDRYGVLTPLAQTTHGPSICQCVFVRVRFDDLPRKQLPKGLQIPEDSPPLERKGEGTLIWRGGGLVQRWRKLEESVKPPAMFTLLRKIQCPRMYSLQRHACILSSTTDLWSHTHTHRDTHAYSRRHRSCCIVRLRQKEMCAQA